MSNGDKRSVSTDALETLGTIIGEGQGRDAIHLAVEPVVAGTLLSPGEDVGFLPDGTVGVCEKALGIVDPFLEDTVKPGERFWLVVYPRQITSLRHVWSHPAFPESDVKGPPVDASVSEAWLRKFCAHVGCDYEYVMEQINRKADDLSYLSSGTSSDGEIPDEFWDHIEIVLGRRVTQRPTYFSCSC